MFPVVSVSITSPFLKSIYEELSPIFTRPLSLKANSIEVIHCIEGNDMEPISHLAFQNVQLFHLLSIMPSNTRIQVKHDMRYLRFEFAFFLHLPTHLEQSLLLDCEMTIVCSIFLAFPESCLKVCLCDQSAFYSIFVLSCAGIKLAIFCNKCSKRYPLECFSIFHRMH